MTADAQEKGLYSAREAAAKPLNAPTSGENAILKKVDQLTSHLKQLDKQTEGLVQGNPAVEAAAAAATTREEQFVLGGNCYP